MLKLVCEVGNSDDSFICIVRSRLITKKMVYNVHRGSYMCDPVILNFIKRVGEK